ncbi:flavin reductase family protein [Halosegnis marinus]|uniref:Flavin reductase family protein n=1 Tax=Halosegnis marinus TaxID=3034023 RepID=A0ABD5ZKA1_9EURY|nr:flavin reductase family protein [Halosegnis sp. DT85]
MEIDAREKPSLYRLLAGAVVPRPIGWISTRGPERDNLAPYSFFNVATPSPPTLAFSAGDTRDGLKDTARNAVESGAFAHNVVTADLAEAMNATATGDEVDEFERAGLAKAECETVDAPYVADAKVVFECETVETVDFGVSTLVLGRVRYVHIDDAVTTDGKLDTTKLDVVGRMTGSEYTRTRDRFAMERPE